MCPLNTDKNIPSSCICLVCSLCFLKRIAIFPTSELYAHQGTLSNIINYRREGQHQANRIIRGAKTCYSLGNEPLAKRRYLLSGYLYYRYLLFVINYRRVWILKRVSTKRIGYFWINKLAIRLVVTLLRSRDICYYETYIINYRQLWIWKRVITKRICYFWNPKTRYSLGSDPLAKPRYLLL